MYYYFLGNTPDLSRAELDALLPTPVTALVSSICASASEFSLNDLAPRLGVNKNLAELIKVSDSELLLADLIDIVSKLPNKNLAITDYAGLNLPKSFLHSLKTSVPRPLRLVSMDTAEHELTMLAKQHVAELNLLPHNDGIAIAHTVWIFAAEDWIYRDRVKPYRDIKRGMLPPKLARILVNLCLRGTPNTSLCDPFCGTGTVLSEAALVGASPLYGSDTNPEAVVGAETNLSWLKEEYKLTSLATNFKLLDATHLHDFVSQVSAIATEPYMGPLLDDRNPLPLTKIQDIAKGLDKLYRGCFKSWAKVLPVGGRVVMTIPSFAVYGRLIPTISIDTISSLGYNYISSFAYGKPGAIVVRNITILEKN